MPTVIKERPIPIYETTCDECGSVFRYKAVEVSWQHITCPVCGVSNWASLTPINDNAPIVETEPVRHGHWIKDDTGAEYCSDCHEYPYDDDEYHIANWHSNYCPNCGAKMDGERREDG